MRRERKEERERKRERGREKGERERAASKGKEDLNRVDMKANDSGILQEVC